MKENCRLRRAIAVGERAPVLVLPLNGKAFFSLVFRVLEVDVIARIDDCEFKQESLVRVSGAIS